MYAFHMHQRITSSAFLISTHNGQVCHRDTFQQGQPCQMPQRHFCYTYSSKALTASHQSWRLPTVKWFVPENTKAVGDRCSPFMERTEETIDFSIVLLRSFV
jgi:hypothetical protein